MARRDDELLPLYGAVRRAARGPRLAGNQIQQRERPRFRPVDIIAEIVRVGRCVVCVGVEGYGLDSRVWIAADRPWPAATTPPSICGHVRVDYGGGVTGCQVLGRSSRGISTRGLRRISTRPGACCTTICRSGGPSRRSTAPTR